MQVTTLRSFAGTRTGYSGGGLLAFAVCDRQACMAIQAEPERARAPVLGGYHGYKNLTDLMHAYRFWPANH